MVDLDRPFDTPRTCNVVHQGMWEVGVVQWNPHHSRASYIASTVTADRNTSLLILLISGQYQHSDLEYRRKISASILIQGARAYRSRFVAVTHLSRLLTFGDPKICVGAQKMRICWQRAQPMVTYTYGTHESPDRPCG